MTYKDIPSSLRRIASALEKSPESAAAFFPGERKSAYFAEDQAVGAACMLVYLRGLFMDSGRPIWDIPALLVLLETISRDPDLFPLSIGTLIWEAEDTDPPEENDE